MRPIKDHFSTTTTSTAITKPEYFSPSPRVSLHPRSPWHSPVPYLFGGLAAMLGLIAFALLILACSYWRLSTRLDDGEGGSGDDVERGNEKEGNSDKELEKVYEEKILVIMAGEDKPTFLATPVSNGASSFGAKTHKVENKGGEIEASEKIKEEIMSNNHDHYTTRIQEVEDEEDNRERLQETDLQQN